MMGMERISRPGADMDKVRTMHRVESIILHDKERPINLI